MRGRLAEQSLRLRPPFYGLRQREWRRLLAEWQRRVAGRGHVGASLRGEEIQPRGKAQFLAREAYPALGQRPARKPWQNDLHQLRHDIVKNEGTGEDSPYRGTVQVWLLPDHAGDRAARQFSPVAAIRKRR